MITHCIGKWFCDYFQTNFSFAYSFIKKKKIENCLKDLSYKLKEDDFVTIFKWISFIYEKI